MKIPRPISDLRNLAGSRVQLGRNTFTVTKVELHESHNRFTPDMGRPQVYSKHAHLTTIRLELVSDGPLELYDDGSPMWEQEYLGEYLEDAEADRVKQLPMPKITEVRHYDADWKGDEDDE